MARGDDLEGLRPYLELAREIRTEVERVATGAPDAAADLAAAFEVVPRRERERVARMVFDRLAPAEQWAVLAEVFDDDEIRAALDELHAAQQADIARRRADIAHARVARAAGRIDLDGLPAGVELTLGLFRPEDVRSALARGHVSSVCARQLVVRTTETTIVNVLEDVFNPRRGFFVTPDYDERVWAAERLASHERVRLGSADDGTFEAVVYPGGRLDVEVDGIVRPGHLHLGFALIGGEDVFAATS